MGMFKRVQLWAVGASTALMTGPAWAIGGDLPDPPAPDSGGGDDDNWFELIQGALFDGGLIIATLVSLISFIWVSYAGLTKFNEARSGKAEWSEVGLLAVVGAGLLVFTGFLLQQALAITGN